MHARVLVVDDDVALRRAVARALELDGYEVDVAQDGLEALTFFENGAEHPDAVILDVLMPNLDGFATCRRIRELSSVPVLMLTARQTVGDRVDGLDAGADHYLGKPFALSELLARLSALIRRTAVPDPDRVLRYADLELNVSEHRVYRTGQLIELTRIEFALLELFMSYPQRVLSRSTIFNTVWGLRHRVRLELAGCIHQVRPSKDGGVRRCAADPDRARHRVRPPGEMMFGRGLA
jgi:two-component system response regulator MprA